MESRFSIGPTNRTYQLEIMTILESRDRVEKSKIPVWVRAADYNLDYTNLISTLIVFSSKEDQWRIWVRQDGPEVGCSLEGVIGFDDSIRYFKHLLRTKEIQLSKDKIRAILRLHAMVTTFWRWANEDPASPDDGGPDWELYVIEHTYFEKIRKQAQYALSLLKK